MRDLSYFEKFYYYRHLHSLSSSIFIAAKYDGIQLTPDLIYNCVANIIQKHPHFYLNIFEKESKNPFLDKINRLNLVQIIQFVDRDIEDVGLIKDLINFKFEYNNDQLPLWKVLVLKDNWILFSCDHLLFDGVSCANFHECLLQEFNRGCTQYKQMEELAKIPYSVHPEDVINIYKPPKLTLSFMFTVVLPFLLDTISNLLLTIPLLSFFFFSKKKDILSNSGFLIQKKRFIENYQKLNVPSDKLTRLHGLCKKRNVTLTSLLLTLFGLALQRNSVGKDDSITIGLPINIRCKANTSIDESKFGLFLKSSDITITDYLEPCNLGTMDFWKVVSLINAKIRKDVKDDKLFNILSLLNFVDIDKWLQDKIDRPPTSSFEFSNIGLKFCPSEFTEKCQIVDSLFCQYLGFQNYFNISCISTVKGGTNFSFNYPYELTDEVKAFIKTFQQYIDVLLED
ncbi:uncharacterized protein SCODWIG_03488 [Saccharomycodes ludwigii]|uniref:N-acetyltransferase SLI1 n=1 Tax=Saccharomycodes ludwigii TaxID=36035 RepID=A0A376BAS6_9ASCO|nr:uncharacterized protein SCODWIG_03488 [Saccharomycodes ludwigii]